MQVALRVLGQTLDGVVATAVEALNDFFETTPYTYTLNYIQADLVYDEDGKPTQYMADIQASDEF